MKAKLQKILSKEKYITPPSKRDNLNNIKRTGDNKSNSYMNKSLKNEEKKKYSFKKRKKSNIFIESNSFNNPFENSIS